MNQFETVNILGLDVAVLDFVTSIEIIETMACRDEGGFISFSNAHTSMMAYFLDEYRDLSKRADIVLADGMPVVWTARFLGYRNCSRVSGPNLMEEVLARSPGSGLSHFFYGAGEGVPEKLKEKYTSRYPGLVVAGAYSPPFGPLTDAEDAEITERINSSGADILWVGLGSPAKERFIVSHLERLRCVQVSVGAGLDFLSGNKPRAPELIQNAGLEWAFRLSTEPRRLWKRYASTNPVFTALVACQLTLGLERTMALRGKLDWLGEKLFGDIVAS
ncbi:MAG: WecB/TagA/CpsF family glycosyltransferase [Deltaproteobacteria bacterium]|nr:WecB/TagA/CpsF family glycosyltransferase [Deltaproteobacteria bacterium]